MRSAVLLKKFLYIITFFSLINCSKSSSIFEDGFEEATLFKEPLKPWVISGKGKVFVDNSRAYSGKKSVHIISGEGYKNRAFLSLSNIFPLEENAYYGKMQMFVKKASPDGIHWTMIQGSGKVKNAYTAEIRYGGQHNKKLMANYDTVEVESDCWQHSKTKIPENKWFRIQWYFNGNKNLMKLWINDKLISDLSIKGKGEGCVNNETNGNWYFPVFEKLSIGWVDYQKGGGNREIWIDDVTISSEYIN